MKARLTKEPADVCEYYTQDCNISFLATATYHPPKDSTETLLVLVGVERNIKDVV